MNNSRTMFLLLLPVLIIGCTALPTSTPIATIVPRPIETSAPTVEDETYAVYNALFTQGFRTPPLVVIYEHTHMGDLSYLEAKGILENNVPDGVLTNFYSVRNPPLPLKSNLFQFRVALVSDAELDQFQQATGEPEAFEGSGYNFWHAFDENYPDAQQEWFALSKVGFNETFDQALVAASDDSGPPTEGTSEFFYFEKRDSKWKLQGRYLLAIV